MDINDLKLGDLKQILALSCTNAEDKTPRFVNQTVIVRTYSAGVHYGFLVWRSGTEAILNNARRVFRWKGAFTLNEVANYGVSEGSKLSEPVDTIFLTEAIEFIRLSDEIIQVFDNFKAYKP